MVRSAKVVIVSASLGFGHQRIAETVKESLEAQCFSTQVVDLLEESRTLLRIKEVYLAMLEKKPSVYGSAYAWSRKAGSTTGLFFLLCRNSLEKVRRRLNPDALIFVHPFGAAAYRSTSGVPAYAVISDLAFHPLWFNPEMRGYFVAREGIGDALEKRGFPRHRVYCTGIPIAAGFQFARSRKSGDARLMPSTEMHLRGSFRPAAPETIGNEPFVLVMGGGLGIGPLQEAVGVLEALDMRLQGAVLTGQNRQLYADLQSMLKGSPNRWQVLPFIEGIEHLMGRADLLISKGGAVTLSEAAACGLPVVIHSPLPGQEEENAFVAAAEGWACQASPDRSLRQVVQTLLASPLKRNEMSQQARLWGKPRAADELAEILMTELNTPVRVKTS